MNTETFFQSQKPQSYVKARIVSNYFWIWAKVIFSTMTKNKRLGPIQYLDLFCGPGRYEDGHPSTPLLILEKALRDKGISQHLRMTFNDEEKHIVDKLAQEIQQFPDIGNLSHKPVFLNRPAESFRLRDFYPTFPHKVWPTLMFVDPFGYKGISPDLLSLVNCWGCDVIFFLNFHQVNRAVMNPVMQENINQVFGEDSANFLRIELMKKEGQITSIEREKLLMETLEKAIKLKVPELQPILTFKFLDRKADKTNHYIAFLTKNQFAFSKMKEVMSNVSKEDGAKVGTFEFDPKKAAPPKHGQMLFDFPVSENELEKLKDHLLKRFKGKKLKVRELFYEDQILHKTYTEQNYKDALRELEVEGKLVVEYNRSRKSTGSKLTMPDTAEIFFP